MWDGIAIMCEEAQKAKEIAENALDWTHNLARELTQHQQDERGLHIKINQAASISHVAHQGVGELMASPWSMGGYHAKDQGVISIPTKTQW